MANVKSRLKAPKSASTKKKNQGPKTKKSSAGPKKSHPKKTDIDSNVVMKRPCTRPVLTPDQKVKFLLKNGHKLKERFIAKPPVNVKKLPEVESDPKPNEEPEGSHRKKQDSSLPLLTKSGHIKKKKKKCNIKLLDSILKNELMIGGQKKTVSANAVTTLAPMVVPPSMDVPAPRVRVDNNNDIQITDQNTKTKEFDDEVVNLSDVESEHSEDSTDNENSAEDLNGKAASNKKIKLSTPQHVTLKNGVVLNLKYYECDNCNRTFNRKGSLRRHMYVHLGIKPFQCKHCPQRFRSEYNKQIHYDRTHKSILDDTELYICNYCEKPFLVKENLKKHLETHTKTGNSFKCIYCDKVFPYHILLMQHEKRHLVKGRHQCTLCSMSYGCRNLLYLHVKSHLKIKDFICQYCGKEFLRPNSLKRHVEVSHGDHRIVCPICKKKLRGHLTEHMRTHEKKRPHVCPECGQRFTQSTQLNVHRRAHTGDRPYPCRICKRLFSHSNALMLHIRRHTGEKPFPCAMCPMSFSQLPHMKTHMRKIHGKENPYKCAHCGNFYKLKAELDVHEKACAGGSVDEPAKGKRKKAKKGEEEIEVESTMSLSRMRFLLALLLTMIATKEKLKYLGFNKRLVDEILVESLEAMDQTPCKDASLPPAKRLRTNIEMFINGTVPKNQMETFKKEHKSTEDILELLTTDKDK
ncbi:hypothetical protein PYW07_013686 [Mythimna separata]|uniref:C2H2-type domain-containing protein n=1 Tax=Mythimna separata TaxID=271217 RepID=A0AAD8DQ32_MYTSE|nr:hypothetical protein PYW07_013686 [Mythimna separata]